MYFQCLPDRTVFLEYTNKLDVLISAYRASLRPSMVKSLKYAASVFVDSGMISAWRNGHTAWMGEQSRVLQFAEDISADYVAMLDLPMEPHLIELNGWTHEAAMTMTIGNASRFMHYQTNIMKVFVLQGWTLEDENFSPSDYKYCASVYDRIGVWDIRPRPWIGVGTTCMRTPKQGLYTIYQWVRDNFPEYHIHAFGIGNEGYISELVKIGIDSIDNAKASCDVAFNRGITKHEGKRDKNIIDSQFMKAFNLQHKRTRKVLKRRKK